LLNAVLVKDDGARFNCSRFLVVIPPDLVPVGSGAQCKAVQPGNLPADHTLLSAIKLEMFDPAGKPLTTFSPPFAVCVTYNDSDLQTAKGDSTKLIIMTDGTDGAWTELTNTTVDTTTHDVCADIGHLSQIGLFARVPAPVPSPCWR
jgi:hypothetical protein